MIIISISLNLEWCDDHQKPLPDTSVCSQIPATPPHDCLRVHILKHGYTGVIEPQTTFDGGIEEDDGLKKFDWLIVLIIFGSFLFIFL